jgi:hypothetical protein
MFAPAVTPPHHLDVLGLCNLPLRGMVERAPKVHRLLWVVDPGRSRNWAPIQICAPPGVHRRTHYRPVLAEHPARDRWLVEWK